MFFGLNPPSDSLRKPGFSVGVLDFFLFGNDFRISQPAPRPWLKYMVFVE